MTIQAGVGTTETKECPAWCGGCTAESEGGYGHFGNEREVGLSLMAPKTGEDILHGQSYCEPATLGVYIEQIHGASLPTIKLSRGEMDREQLTLTFDEAWRLVEILGDLTEQAKAAVFAAADKERSDR